MGCGCGGASGEAKIKYQVTFKDGSKRDFVSTTEAQNAIRSSGGGRMRAVRA